MCVPARANAVWQTAWPPVATATGAPEQPEIGAPPSVNMTVPPSGVGATVAVNDTPVPARTLLADETNVVVVWDAAGGSAIVYAVTWSPLATNSLPPPALGLAKWLTLALIHRGGRVVLSGPERRMTS